MTTENMYGEPWEPPPLMVVNVAASRLVEESGKVCKPTPQDVGAIMTIYQSHTWPSRGVP